MEKRDDDENTTIRQIGIRGNHMDVQKNRLHRIAKTIIAMGILLVIFFFQGATVMVNNLEGIVSAVVRGGIIWGLVLITIGFYNVKYRTLHLLGFNKPNNVSFKQLYFFVPLILIALTNFSCGIDMSNGMGMIFANLFLALGIGFCEEIFFRGIICNLWLKKGEGTAIMISSILFAICHLMNIAGGAGIVETILQICFAFVYGIVFALIFIVCQSVWPCIILHAFHDFSSFISIEGSVLGNIIIGAAQFVILLCYAFVIIKRRRKAMYE